MKFKLTISREPPVTILFDGELSLSFDFILDNFPGEEVFISEYDEENEESRLLGRARLSNESVLLEGIELVAEY